VQLRALSFKKLRLAGDIFLSVQLQAKVFTGMFCDFSAAFGSADKA